MRLYAAAPGSAEATCFLGVAELLSGQDERGIATLRDAVALGDTPWQDEARLQLGKALVRRGDLDDARRVLAAVRADSEFAAAAAGLLRALDGRG